MKIGNTPVVALAPGMFVKLEGRQPGQSMKIRSAWGMTTKVKPGQTVIEATSGNLGVGLSLIGRERGFKVVLLVDPKLSPYHRKLMLDNGCHVDRGDGERRYRWLAEDQVEDVGRND
jgi:cysteine synthase A